MSREKTYRRIAAFGRMGIYPIVILYIMLSVMSPKHLVGISFYVPLALVYASLVWGANARAAHAKSLRLRQAREDANLAVHGAPEARGRSGGQESDE